MTEFTDVSGAFGYGDSILAGERVRLRGVRDDDLPTLARWEMDAGRLITLSNWVAPPPEAAAMERIAKRSANDAVLMSILDHEWAGRRLPGP
jgi:RimJ/RimL family protein N-acetyltransferase